MHTMLNKLKIYKLYYALQDKLFTLCYTNYDIQLCYTRYAMDTMQYKLCYGHYAIQTMLCKLCNINYAIQLDIYP